MSFPLPVSSQADEPASVVSLVGPLATGRAVALDAAQWVRDQPCARARILPLDLSAALEAFAWLAQRDAAALQSLPVAVAEELLALADALRDAMDRVPAPAHLAIAFSLWRGELASLCNTADLAVDELAQSVAA